MGKKPLIPCYLSAESKQIWLEIEAGWKLDAHSRTILRELGEAFDKMRQVRNLVGKFRLLIKSPSGLAKLNPAVQALKVSRASFSHSWRMLTLGVEPPDGRS